MQTARNKVIGGERATMLAMVLGLSLALVLGLATVALNNPKPKRVAKAAILIVGVTIQARSAKATFPATTAGDFTPGWQPVR
jgi:hypothetical protein